MTARSTASFILTVTAIAAALAWIGPTTAQARASVATNYAIGDSVMIDARSSLRADLPGIVVDAAVSRQVSAGVAILQRKRRAGTINPHTVFGLGTNGTFTGRQMSRIIRLTRGHRLYVVTTHCRYCSWTAANNRMVNRRCTPRYHCWVVPFAARARQHPEWFTRDGVHMTPGGAGARAYAELVRATIRASSG